MQLIGLCVELLAMDRSYQPGQVGVLRSDCTSLVPRPTSGRHFNRRLLKMADRSGAGYKTMIVYILLSF